MCGLIGFFNFETKTKEKETIKPKPINEELVLQLQDQIARGSEGFGVLIMDKDKKVEVKRSTEISKILINIYQKESNMMILHHRNPTSSENKISQTHPLLVSNKELEYDYYVIHNGVIWNTHQLKKTHIQRGYEYKTERTREINGRSIQEFNDSESLAIELALYVENKKNIIEAKGSIAFIMVRVNKRTQIPEKVYFGTKGNPLKISGKQGQIRLSSEGKGTDVKEETLYEFSIKEPKMTKRPLEFVSTTYYTTEDKTSEDEKAKEQKELKTMRKYSRTKRDEDTTIRINRKLEEEKEIKKNTTEDITESMIITEEEINEMQKEIEEDKIQKEIETDEEFNKRVILEAAEEKEDELEEELTEALEIIAKEFEKTSTEIIIKIKEKFETNEKLTSFKLEQEKKELATKIIANLEKSIILAKKTQGDLMYEIVSKKAKALVETEEEKELIEETETETEIKEIEEKAKEKAIKANEELNEAFETAYKK